MIIIRPTRLLLVLALARAILGQASHSNSAPSCIPVSGERIEGRDMAAAVPEFASLPSDISLGYSPLPGVNRVFLVPELRKLALRYGIDTKINSPACFAWPVHPLSRQAIMDALLRSLDGYEAEIDITDQCQLPVPEGEVVFPRQGLSAESSHPALWNGYVAYAGNRKFNTWVQVRVVVHEKEIVAARAIRAGDLIGPADIKTVDYTGPLQRTLFIHHDHEAAGKYARRPIALGTAITEFMLALPQDVERQQIVTVHTRCGAAHIETQGVAVEAGYRGDIIKVKNPKSGRVFPAQISDHGVVTVVPGGDVSLVVNDKKS